MYVFIYIYKAYYVFIWSWNQLPWLASFFSMVQGPAFCSSARSEISAAPGMTDSGPWDGRPPGWWETCGMDFPPFSTKNIHRPSRGCISPDVGPFYCFCCCLWLLSNGLWAWFLSTSQQAPQFGDGIASFFKDRLGSCFNQGFGIIWNCIEVENSNVRNGIM